MPILPLYRRKWAWIQGARREGDEGIWGEHALAHQLKDKAEAAYQRGSLFEKRKGLMNDLARYYGN